MSQPYIRKEVIGDATLYLGDALEVLPTISDADCCVCDPPYLVSKGGSGPNAAFREFGGWTKEYLNSGVIVDCDISFSDWLPLVYAALRQDAQAYFMSNGRNLATMQGAAEAAKFKLHTLLVWDKRSALPNKYYQNVTEFGLFMYKGKAFTINDPSSKNLVSLFQKDESEHPTEKPVDLMALWIGNSTDPGETVIDPFCGSGTTGVAAIKTGRKFVGIEKNEKFFDIACKRIERAKYQPTMFEISSPQASQEIMAL